MKNGIRPESWPLVELELCRLGGVNCILKGRITAFSPGFKQDGDMVRASMKSTLIALLIFV